MTLPNGDHAIIDEHKIWGYLLNPNHEHGGAHAYLFKRLLDVDLQNWTVLRDALLSAARQAEAISGKETQYGRKFEVRFQMEGPRGAYSVLSIWIIPKGEEIPHLVTAYIE